MADTTTHEAPAMPEEAVKTTGANGEATPPATEGGDKPKLYTQEDLDRIAAKVRGEEKTRQQKDADRLQQSAEQQRLAEQGEFKTLHQQSEVRAQELQAEIESLRLENLRTQVAAKHRLPEEIGKRLQGATREEMEKDAASLAKHLAPPKAPDTEGGARQGGDGVLPLAKEVERQAQRGHYAAL